MIALGFSCTNLVDAKVPDSNSLTPASKVEIASKNLVNGKISQAVKKVNGRDYHVAQALIPTSPEHIWRYLTDYQMAPKIFSNLNKIQLIDQKANKKKVAFQVSSLGGLMKFDYVLHLTETAPRRIDWERASGAFKRNEGFWILNPVKDGKFTLVTYGKHIDGGMFVPKMIVDKQLRGTMQKVMKNLISQVKNDHRRLAQK